MCANLCLNIRSNVCLSNQSNIHSNIRSNARLNNQSNIHSNIRYNKHSNEYLKSPSKSFCIGFCTDQWTDIYPPIRKRIYPQMNTCTHPYICRCVETCIWNYGSTSLRIYLHKRAFIYGYIDVYPPAYIAYSV